MNPFGLLTSQRDVVFQLIVRMGFDPSDFEWEEVASQSRRSQKVPVLLFRDGSYFFRFDFQDDGFTSHRLSVYSPGSDRLVDGDRSNTFDEQLLTMAGWLRHLSRELEAPNFWSLATAELELFREPAALSANEPFNEGEQSQIELMLRAVESQVRALTSVTEDQKEAFAKVTDELIRSSSRVGRRDWFFMLLGSVTSWAITVAVPPTEVYHILGLVGRGVSGVLGR